MRWSCKLRITNLSGLIWLPNIIEASSRLVFLKAISLDNHCTLNLMIVYITESEQKIISGGAIFRQKIQRNIMLNIVPM
jgi:hypothetical protein